MSDPQPKPPTPTPGEAVRPHVFDGIQEYDKRMPNWWLFTLFASIAFAFGYWIYSEHLHLAPDAGAALTAQMKALTSAATEKAGEITDDTLWTMSKDTTAVAAGKATFDATCASCHRPDLLGMIGPNLKDKQWVHDDKPLGIVKVIEEGVLAKGMPPWGPVLGKAKIMEAAAYILSFHEKGEPSEIAPWVPVLTPPPAPTP